MRRGLYRTRRYETNCHHKGNLRHDFFASLWVSDESLSGFVASAQLFVMERNHWIHFRRTPRHGRAAVQTPVPGTALFEVADAVWVKSSVMKELHDFRYAARQLRKNAGFALFSMATIAIGIASATVALSILDPWLIRPLALKDARQLHHLWRTNASDHTQPAFYFEYRDYLQFAKEARCFSSLSATFYRSYTLSGRGEPHDVMSEIATANLFDTLGIHAFLGRTFSPGDANGEKVAVLSYPFWSQKFGASRSVIGQTLKLNDEPYRVIGVLPRDFSYRILDQPVDSAVWTVIQRGDPSYQQDSSAAVAILGRLKPSMEGGQAQAELNTIQKRSDQRRAHLPEGFRGSTTLVSRLQEDNARQIRFSLLVLTGAVSFLLLIACANTCALILGRNETRRAEFAMRVALGCSARGLFKQLFAENLLLYAGGAICGLAIAATVLRGFELWNPLGVLPARGVDLSLRVFGLAASITFLTSIVFGTLPAFLASRADLNNALRGTSRSLTADHKRVHTLTWITGAQISLALVLVTGAGLLFTTLLQLEHQNFGFATAQIQTFVLSLPSRHYRELSRAVDFEERLLATLRRSPRVTSAAAGRDPAAGDRFLDAFAVSDQPSAPSSNLPRAAQTSVSSQFFAVLKIPILRGSDFPLSLSKDSEPLAIISESVAQRYFRHDNPIGKHIRFGVPSDPNTAHAPWHRIIGVVGDTRSIAYNNTAWKSDPQVYLDFRQAREDGIGATNWGSRRCTFLIATDSLHGLPLSELQRAVWSLDTELPVELPESLTSTMTTHLAQPKMRAQVLTGFAGISLFLAAIGLYGVLSQSVAQRKREIAIRLALGAERKDVVRLILGRALAIATAGVLCGTIIAGASARTMHSVLYGVSALNPLLYAGAVGVLLAVAMIAAFVPARRAATVDPMTSLRAD
jgi:putative ABC transport system permease protein